MKEFSSQVCTSVEQSKRLLAMGLKPETADMYHTTFYMDNVGYEIIQVRNEKLPLLSQEIPAWSLHRLMIIGNIGKSGFTNVDEAYNTCISLIASHIRFGLLNKEYFKQ